MPTNVNTKRIPAKITISARMKRSTKDMIDKVAGKRGMTKSALIEAAVLKFFQKAA